MKILECALQMEQEAQDHYAALAAASSVPELQRLFAMLAKAEEEHRQALEKLGSCTAHKELEFPALDAAACTFSPLLEQREALADSGFDADGYRTARQAEEESIRRYREMAENAPDEATRQLLLALAREEERHLSIIENIYAFMESPRTYLAWGEFANLKEY